jgi:hypothetical protein
LQLSAERTVRSKFGPRNGEFLANTAHIPRLLSTEIYKGRTDKRIPSERAVESM